MELFSGSIQQNAYSFICHAKCKKHFIIYFSSLTYKNNTIMAITDQTSISSSYQRIGGSNPIITKSGRSELSPATQERLRLAEQRQLEEEKALANRRRLEAMSPFERAEELAKQTASEMSANKAAYGRMQAALNQKRYGLAPVSKTQYSGQATDFSTTFKGVK
jgi:hypothetical protein